VRILRGGAKAILLVVAIEVLWVAFCVAVIRLTEDPLAQGFFEIVALCGVVGLLVLAIPAGVIYRRFALPGAVLAAVALYASLAVGTHHASKPPAPAVAPLPPGSERFLENDAKRGPRPCSGDRTPYDSSCSYFAH
jgi:hypothetical protein